jgi:hypothetical protein
MDDTLDHERTTESDEFEQIVLKKDQIICIPKNELLSER